MRHTEEVSEHKDDSLRKRMHETAERRTRHGGKRTGVGQKQRGDVVARPYIEFAGKRQLVNRSALSGCHSDSLHKLDS